MTRPLVATYRLQLDPTFDFDAATGLAEHLKALGISHVYLSPVFAARPGSTHGYDVVDPTRIRDELGGRPALDALAAALHGRGLGIVADIVPNHLAADEHDRWWWDVLRDGADSPYASVFDVDWPAGGGRILLPVLGAPLADTLAAGDLTVDTSGHEPVVRYFDRRFPLRPDVDATTALPGLLAAQHYTLTHWRARSRNVRRFFDIDDLVGVRVEDPEVFAATHALVVELATAGIVDALRLDHVDGLRDPRGYLERLAAVTGVPLLVEKVLGPDEALPDDWPVAGTTGYEHLADLDALFVDADGLRAMDRDYRAAGGQPFPAVDRAARAQVLTDLFPSEWAARADEAAALLDVAPEVARRVVRELTLGLDVYRTYLAAARPVDPDDRRRLLDARRRAEAGAAEVDAALGRLVDLLVAGDPGAIGWAARWQQLSGAVMAKGHEDTAYYRHTRLLALDEVGGDPDGPLRGDAIERFHVHQQQRLASGQPGLTTTTTHDTKRSEDARARILALSELQAEWEAAVGTFAAGAPVALDHDELRLVAQTLLASWPTAPDAWPDYPDRIGRYLRKALREAKRSTSWTDPDDAHEDTVLAFASSLLDAEGAAFDRHFGDLRARIAIAGAAISLTRLVVKHATPGTPDVYRGCERWALDLADPDNRRPVDHARDVDALHGWRASPPDLGDLRRRWTDGRIKLWCTWRSLVARRDRPDLFRTGAYVPLPVSGPGADDVIAFARTHGAEHAVVIGARRTAHRAGTDGFPVGTTWIGTEVALPDGLPPLHDALRPGADAAPATGRVDDALAVLPVALLVSARPAAR